MRRVIMESPFGSADPSIVDENTRYARLCMLDCLRRGDSPMASHTLYTQPGVLDDNVPEERALGIEAGLAWGVVADATVVYTDRGISEGMNQGIERADKEGRTVEFRTLPLYVAPLLARKAFVICPVRGVSEDVSRQIYFYVSGIEASGRTVHWPQRDTNQDDPIGLDICKQNRKAIHEADEVHIWYDAKSQGSVFDFGMTFAYLLSMKKDVFIINPEDVQPTSHKSFQNVLLALAKAPQ